MNSLQKSWFLYLFFCGKAMEIIDLGLCIFLSLRWTHVKFQTVSTESDILISKGFSEYLKFDSSF